MTLSRRSALTGGLVLGLGPLGLAACSRNPSATEDIGFVGGDGSYSVVPLEKRVAAPALTGTDLDGKDITTEGLLGTVLVLNVWGSWCSPCRLEAPELVKAAERTKGRAQFFGLNTRDNNQAPAKAFERGFKVPYKSFYDPHGALIMTLRALPASAIPSTLFIDRQGRIAARILGEATASTFVGAIDDLVAGK